MVESAWVSGSFEGEMEAYELLSIQYYYLGMLEKSQYYHDRSLHGKSEPKNSPTYTMVMQNYLASQVLEHEKSNFVSKERVRERMYEGKQFVTRTRIKDYSLASPHAVQILLKMRAMRVHPYSQNLGKLDIMSVFSQSNSKIKPGVPIICINEAALPSPCKTSSLLAAPLPFWNRRIEILEEEEEEET